MNYKLLILNYELPFGMIAQPRTNNLIRVIRV